MNVDLLEESRRRVPNLFVLVNMVSKRVKQMILGDRPLVKPAHPDEEVEDVVLREIADGKLVAEIDFSQVRNLAEK